VSADRTRGTIRARAGRGPRGGEMLLTIDVGNTHTVLGLFEGETIAHRLRLSSRRDATADEVDALIAGMLLQRGIGFEAIDDAILASVVPPLTEVFEKLCADRLGRPPMVVGPGIKTGMQILYDNPREVGADRIVNAVAAYERHRCPLVVVDFGTATTFDAVTGKGEYLGGAIAPGLDVAMDGLFSRTAKLPRIELKPPTRVVGKNTIQALQSGLYFGYAGLVDELASRMRAELGEGTKVVATGGLAKLFAEVSTTLDEVDDFLTLEGLHLLYQRNVGTLSKTPSEPRANKRPTK
jgi:type III pantothenate kinase